ncbi:hypothetical protein QYE76_026854 [Lolium multiflorum]|uniref:O-methyltransferase C-terminal domain-containing protein n=1 Tax=Lolium multiflorum TaxID=4521 RepID=A0AAD8RI32_LOLMU|nr:hypothetical protein QYE76_026854 [Lolium multiflorum]
MTGVSEPFMEALLDGYAGGFDGVATLVDVGGSSGACLEMIMKRVGTRDHPGRRQLRPARRRLRRAAHRRRACHRPPCCCSPSVSPCSCSLRAFAGVAVLLLAKSLRRCRRAPARQEPSPAAVLLHTESVVVRLLAESLRRPPCSCSLSVSSCSFSPGASPTVDQDILIMEMLPNNLFFTGVRHVGGDMFKSIPSGDAIFMKWVLTTWTNDECTAILKNCHKALPEGGKLIACEPVVPETTDTSTRTRALLENDIFVMTTYRTQGRERSEEEFRQLGLAAGFTGFRALYLDAFYAVLEYVK